MCLLCVADSAPSAVAPQRNDHPNMSSDDSDKGGGLLPCPINLSCLAFSTSAPPAAPYRRMAKPGGDAQNHREAKELLEPKPCVWDLKACILKFQDFSGCQERPAAQRGEQQGALSLGPASCSCLSPAPQGEGKRQGKLSSQCSLPVKVEHGRLFDSSPRLFNLGKETGKVSAKHELGITTSQEGGKTGQSRHPTTKLEHQQFSHAYWAQPEGIQRYQFQDTPADCDGQHSSQPLSFRCSAGAGSASLSSTSGPWAASSSATSTPNAGVSSTTAGPGASASVRHPSTSLDHIRASFDAAKLEILRIVPARYHSKVSRKASDGGRCHLGLLPEPTGVQAFDGDGNGPSCQPRSFPQSVRMAGMMKVLNSRLNSLSHNGYFSETSVPTEYEPQWFEASGEFFSTAMPTYSEAEKGPSSVCMSDSMHFETERLSRDLVAISSFQDMASRAVYMASQEPVSPADTRAIKVISRAMLRASIAAAGVSMALTSNLELSRRQGLLDKCSLAHQKKKKLGRDPLGNPQQFVWKFQHLQERRKSVAAPSRGC